MVDSGTVHTSSRWVVGLGFEKSLIKIRRVISSPI